MKISHSAQFAALLMICLVSTVSCKKQYDVCVYGGTASGVMAAYSAAQRGMDVLLIEPGCQLGGMTTGGLGQTDVGFKTAIRGIARRFYRQIGQHYGKPAEFWTFEPSVAQKFIDEYASHRNISVVYGKHLAAVSKDGTSITDITVTDDAELDSVVYSARWFIDCSYEGDLMAASGVEYVVGREGNDKYSETLDGVQRNHAVYHQFPDGVDPYVVKGDSTSGLLWGISSSKLLPDGTADKLLQAYNYRICLTDSVQNMIPIEKPDDYRPERYELLLRLIDAQPEQTSARTYFIWSMMPNRKTDINNRGGFSTDMIGESANYPDASWKERQQILKRHRDYTLGLFYFWGHDERVPKHFRDEILQWGLPKDEYIKTDHWTPQIYVREARRMVGRYVATQADCLRQKKPADSVAMASYTMDSHHCQRVVIRKNGVDMVKNEGDVEVGTPGPYPISYSSLTPKEDQCTNLLVPVCLSASHMAYGSIRMEPVFMDLGQVAGVAVSIARQKRLSSVQDVDFREINEIIGSDPFMDGSKVETYQQ